jgi:uncharacterized OB-fold protein
MSFEKFGWVSYASQTRLGKFIEYLQDGRICGTKCKECGALQFPPRAHCVRCLSTSYEWATLTGICKLITFTKVEVTPPAFQGHAPYALGLAELDEGPKVFAWIDKAVREGQIAPGKKMRLKASKLPNGNLVYVLTNPDA